MAITGFTAALSVYARKTLPEELNRRKQALAEKALERLVRKTPVDTGRARGNWTISLGAPTARHQESTFDKDGSETIAKGRSRIKTSKPGQAIHIENAVNYGIPLELGHSRQAPQGMLRPVVQELVREAAQKGQK